MKKVWSVNDCIFFIDFIKALPETQGSVLPPPRSVIIISRNLRADHVGEHRTAFEKNRKKILAVAQVCGICGNPLDPSHKYPHPLSTVVDHIVPINRGGHPSDLQNLQAAHRWCNRQKSDKLFDIKDRLKEQEDIIGNDLPLHYNWKEYKVN